MNKKYKFVLIIVENEIEIHSDEEIEGQSPSLVETWKMKGIFDSYEDAKKAAEEFKVLKVVVTHDHDDGDWIEEEDSIDDYSIYFFSYIAAESWAYSRLEDEEYEDDDGETHTINSEFEIIEVDNIDIEIVEIS